MVSKNLSMRTRIWAASMLMLAAALTCYGQDTTTTDTSQATASTQSPASTQSKPAFVFPDKHERFRRYLKSTAGPLRLGWSAASAGIGQWRDSPEEWGQGAQGFGKRYASSFGSNA